MNTEQIIKEHRSKIESYYDEIPVDKALEILNSSQLSLLNALYDEIQRKGIAHALSTIKNVIELLDKK